MCNGVLTVNLQKTLKEKMKMNYKEPLLKQHFVNYFIPLVVVSHFVWCSCGNKSGNRDRTNKSNYSVVTEIPRNQNGEPVSDYRITKAFQKQAGLDSLEKGYDSLQIRIWGGHSQLLEFYLLIISKREKKWHGKLITLEYTIDPKSGVYQFKNKRSKTVSPKSGWEVFVKRLFDFQVTSLPDMSELGYESGEDGSSYMVEVATNKSYRFYSYWSPAEYQNKYPAAKSMYSIAQFVESEFGFQFTSGH